MELTPEQRICKELIKLACEAQELVLPYGPALWDVAYEARRYTVIHTPDWSPYDPA